MAAGRALNNKGIVVSKEKGSILSKCPKNTYKGLPIGWGTVHIVEAVSQSPES
jgi:hypothetical protein